MPNPVKAIPDGYHSITPSLTCKNASHAIEFYKRAFGATEIMRMPTPDGRVAHAELKIGDSLIMLNDDFAQMASGPSSNAGIYLFLYVENVDEVFNRSIDAGASVDMPLLDQFWGDRFGKITDPSGHHWGLASHVEDVAPDEMARRSAEFMAKAAGQS